MPADDAMMATINADAANDLGSQNAFYDPNVHVNFDDTSILHSAHQQHHFAPWDIPPFPHNVSQINPFEIPTAPEDVSPDTGPIMTRQRRAMIHRQSALIEPDSTAQMFMSPEQLPYPSQFTVQAPAHHIPRPASSPSYNPTDSRPGIHSRAPSWASASDVSIYCALPATPASTSSFHSNHSNISIGRATSPESTASTSISLSSVGSNLFPQNVGHRPTASTSTLDDSTYDSPDQQADETDDEPRATATRARTRSQAKGPRTSKQRRLKDSERKDICRYFIDHPKERQEDIAARFFVERSTISKILKNKDRWLNMDDTEIRTTDRDRKPTKFPSVDKEVLEWVKEKTEKRSPITDAQLKEKAITAARRQGIPEHKFKASGGWVDNFKSRHRIKKGKVLPKQADMAVALDRLNAHITTRMSISSATSLSDAASVIWTDDDVLEQYSPDKPYPTFGPERPTNAGSPERPFLASAMASPARPLQTPSPQRHESVPGQMPHLVMPTPPQTISPQHLQQQQQLPPLPAPPQGQATNASAPGFNPTAAPSHFFPNSFTMFSFNQPSATTMPAMPTVPAEEPQQQPQAGNISGLIPSSPEVRQSLGTIRQVLFGAASQVFTDEEKSTWQSMEKSILNWLMEQQPINNNASGLGPNHFSG